MDVKNCSLRETGVQSDSVQGERSEGASWKRRDLQVKTI